MRANIVWVVLLALGVIGPAASVRSEVSTREDRGGFLADELRYHLAKAKAALDGKDDKAAAPEMKRASRLSGSSPSGWGGPRAN